jgi:TonB family protein
MNPTTFGGLGLAVLGILWATAPRPQSAGTLDLAASRASALGGIRAGMEQAHADRGRPADGVRTRAAPAVEDDPWWRAIDVELAAADTALAAARYEDVLAATPALRSMVVARGDTPGWRARRAHVELLDATVHIGMSEARLAESAMQRALLALPDLSLDEAVTPPKVMALLGRTRHSTLAPAHGVAADASDALEATALSRVGDRAAQLIDAPLVKLPVSESPLWPTITCRILVDTAGRVAHARIHRPRAELAAVEQAALAAVRRYRFEPAQRDGRRVAVWINWPVRFR